MPKFDVTVPHELSQEDAAERLRGFTEKMKEQMGDRVSDLEQTWDGHQMNFGFTTFGFRITGQLAVGGEGVNVSGDLPFAAAMFKGKISSAIEEQIAKILRGR